MEPRIEARHLRMIVKSQRERLDALDLDREMQRREGNQRTQLSDKAGRNALGRKMTGAAMDQAMTDRIGTRQPQTVDLVEERPERLRPVGQRQCAVAQRRPAAVADPESSAGQRNSFGRSFGRQLLGLCGDPIERKLVLGRSAVE